MCAARGIEAELLPDAVGLIDRASLLVLYEDGKVYVTFGLKNLAQHPTTTALETQRGSTASPRLGTIQCIVKDGRNRQVVRLCGQSLRKTRSPDVSVSSAETRP
jgi:hypothetical protein